MFDEIILQEAINDTEMEKTVVYAEVSSITQREYEVAGQKDVKPSYKFTIWEFEYNGQTELEYEGNLLTVYRTFKQPNTEKIELYTEERKGRR